MISFFLKRPSKECSARIERVVVKWYRDEMELLIPQRIERINQYFNDPIVPRSVKYRKMKSSYGNCSKSGSDYIERYVNENRVREHRLCYCSRALSFKMLAHDFEFYSRLNSVMPDWKVRARSLEKDF